VIVVDARGRVLADSAGTDRVGASYANRPEVTSALRGRPAQLERRSDTLDERLLATAVPIVREGRPDGAVRITQAVDAVRDAVDDATLGLSAIGALVLALGLAAGAVIAAQVARPLARLDATARSVAAGRLDARAPVEAAPSSGGSRRPSTT
jgi:HAMP domain-containing protein